MINQTYDANNIFIPVPHKIMDIITETEIDKTYRLNLNVAGLPSYGQFYEVSLPKIGEAPISVSDFEKDWIDLTIRKIGTLTNCIHSLKIGDVLYLRGPYGNFFPVDSFAGKHLVIAAGGCGLAPVRSVINYFYRNLEKLAKFELLMGFKTINDLLFKYDIDRWEKKFKSIITLDHGCDLWADRPVGLITDYVGQVDFSDKENICVIIVGPPVMIKFTADKFVAAGIKKENIIVSMERRMSCGVGKCGHCKIDSTYICCDGPVFTYERAERFID
ncbi:MAG: anaerobic sulfite reductase subunit AsrB [Oligoflexia bacterium]|nr:anaerobic sulfite reductase subunit AsrB [Oligoflexia bacterium]